MELGTPEHYEEYRRECLDAGLIPDTWEMFSLFQKKADVGQGDNVMDEASDNMTGIDYALANVAADLLKLSTVHDRPGTWSSFKAIEDELSTLRAENARLRAALEPFATMSQFVGADFKRAREAWEMIEKH